MAVGMVGVTYAAVPLYRMFCQATGFGGTVREGRSVEQKLRERREGSGRDEAVEAAAAARELTVTFNADVSDGLPWRFRPTQRSVKASPLAGVGSKIIPVPISIPMCLRLFSSGLICFPTVFARSAGTRLHTRQP